MPRSTFVFAFIVLTLTAGVIPARAQDTAQVSQNYVEVKSRDGTSYRGMIVAQDEKSVTVKTLQGFDIVFPREMIESIRPLRGQVTARGFRRADRNYSRLLLSPTGRPLRQGEGYFNDLYIFFPSAAFGVTNNLSVLAGFSIIPGVGLDDQLFYFAPKFGIRASDRFSASVGALYMAWYGLDESVSAGMLFAVGTYGSDDLSVTFGTGLGYAKLEDEETQWAKHPVFILGGSWRLGNSIALVSENWVIGGKDFRLNEQPFVLALRFLGDRLSADFGAILVGEILDAGFPIPWLSITYNFGK